MLNTKLIAEIEGLQKKINEAVTAGFKDESQREVIKQLSAQLAQIAMQEDARAYIVNLTTQTHYFDRSYGRVAIYGVGDTSNPRHVPGELYAVTEIEARHEVMDVLKGLKTLRFPQRYAGDPMAVAQVVNGIDVTHPSILVARDVVLNTNENLPFADEAKKQFKAPGTGGVFISDTPTPSREQLAEETAKLEKYQRALVQFGNVQWKRKPDSREIYDIQRRACEALGISTEWYNLPEKNVICGGCGASIPAGIAVHLACGAVLNEPEAIRLKMIPDPASKRAKQPTV